MSQGGFYNQVQRVIGQTLQSVHLAGGFRARYVLHTDVSSTSTRPLAKTTLVVAMAPTPEVKVRDRIGGRWQDVLSAAGNLSAEALPVFIISREQLKIDGVYYEPTLMDTFQKYNCSTEEIYGPTFYVQQITSIGAIAGGWTLTCSAQFRDHATG